MFGTRTSTTTFSKIAAVLAILFFSLVPPALANAPIQYVDAYGNTIYTDDSGNSYYLDMDDHMVYVTFYLDDSGQLSYVDEYNNWVQVFEMPNSPAPGDFDDAPAETDPATSPADEHVWGSLSLLQYMSGPSTASAG